MNTSAAVVRAATIPESEVPYPEVARRAEPLWIVTGGDTIAVRADGTAIAIEDALEPGADYAILATAAGAYRAIRFTDELLGEDAGVLGGFHYGLGACAPLRDGGDDEPAINPFSLWDGGYRPACPDPRGMVCVVGSPGMPTLERFWCDIYLLAQDHRKGTSRAGAVIADGYRALPDAVDGKGKVAKLDYKTATAIYAHHGKGLLSIIEFFAAAYGVVEREAAEGRDETAGVDPKRTSHFGLMQAVGQRETWGHDGDPDTPRACRFGGRWGDGEYAGSRYAIVVNWPELSFSFLSARGRSDHLSPA